MEGHQVHYLMMTDQRRYKPGEMQSWVRHRPPPNQAEARQEAICPIRKEATRQVFGA